MRMAIASAHSKEGRKNSNLAIQPHRLPYCGRFRFLLALLLLNRKSMELLYLLLQRASLPSSIYQHSFSSGGSLVNNRYYLFVVLGNISASNNHDNNNYKEDSEGTLNYPPIQGDIVTRKQAFFTIHESGNYHYLNSPIFCCLWLLLLETVVLDWGGGNAPCLLNYTCQGYTKTEEYACSYYYGTYSQGKRIRYYLLYYQLSSTTIVRIRTMYPLLLLLSLQ